MNHNSESSNCGRRSSQPPILALGILACVTFVIHLVFGVSYVIKTESLPSRLDLQVSGQAYLESFPGWDTDYEWDSANYNRAAVEVLRTGVPRGRSGAFFLRATSYVYFLAGCYWLGGLRLLALAVPQAILSGLTCFLAGLVAFRVFQRNAKLAMVIAGLLVLANLRVAMYVGYAVPAIFSQFILVAALYLATGTPSAARVGFFSLLMIAGAFSQATFFAVALAGSCWLAILAYRNRSLLQSAAAALIAGGVAAKLAMTILNVGGTATDPQGVADRGGTFWLANNPYYESMGLWDQWEARPGNPWTNWKMSAEENARYEQYLARVGGDEGRAATLWIRENPMQYLKLCAIRLRTEWSPFTGQMSPRNRAVSTVVWLLIYPAGVLGLWHNRASELSRLALLIVLMVTTLATLVIVGWYLRYRFPTELILSIYAAERYASLLTALRERRQQTEVDPLQA